MTQENTQEVVIQNGNGNGITAKTAIIGAAITLLGLATAGFQDGVHSQDIAEFVAGIVLIYIYQFWFNNDSYIQKLKTEIILLKDQTILLNTELTASKNEILLLRTEIASLRAEIVALRNKLVEMTTKLSPIIKLEEP